MIRVIEGSKNLDKLRKLIAPFMMRVRKEDVFKDLPPILWDTVPVPLDQSHLTAPDLEALEKTINRCSPTRARPRASTILTDALRILGNSVGLMALRRMLGLAKLRGATEYIVDMLDNLPADRKVLVFAHHAHVIAALAAPSGRVLPGRADRADHRRRTARTPSTSSCPTPSAGCSSATSKPPGTAITLVGPKCKCSDVVFVESSWTPMDNAQAACRVHRIGQKDGVVARMLSAAGTVDDLINGLLVRKAREFTQLFDTQAGANP